MNLWTKAKPPLNEGDPMINVLASTRKCPPMFEGFGQTFDLVEFEELCSIVYRPIRDDGR